MHSTPPPSVRSSNAFDRCLSKARHHSESRREITHLAHLFYQVLTPSGSGDSAASRARSRIEKELLPAMRRSEGVPPGATAFRPEVARHSYGAFVEASGVRDPSAEQTLLDWLLSGDFSDNARSEQHCAFLCADEGMVSARASRGKPDCPAELGFGRLLTGSRPSHTLPPLLGRSDALEQHSRHLRLSLAEGGHYLLVGQAGVGKTLLLEHLLTTQAVEGRRFLWLTQADFASSQHRNKQRLTQLFSYLERKTEVVPVFDQLEHILERAPQLAETFVELFGSGLATKERSFVLVCEANAARRAREGALRGITSHLLAPLDDESTLRLLVARVLPELSDKYDVQWPTDPEPLCQRILDQARAHYRGRSNPEIALYLADRAAFRANEARCGKLGSVDVQTLRAHVVEELGLDPNLHGEDPKTLYRALAERLKQEVIGQDHAVDRICRHLELQTQLRSVRSPRGRFLLAGPPGVGKTELARRLAEGLGFGKDGFFKFNMGEYVGEDARTRFMGAGPGYRDHGATQTIYDCVASRPACLILLDEIDRAHACIQDALLSILEGEGKDAKGRSVYFSQAIFVMTTNLGKEAVTRAYDARGTRTRSELSQDFTEERLRTLVLRGAADPAELSMGECLDQAVLQCKRRFLELRVGEEPGSLSTETLQCIDQLCQLQSRARALESAIHKTPLDSAFLDRVQSVTPFFPIREPDLLGRILDNLARARGVSPLTPELRARVLRAALDNDNSARALGGLLEQHLATEQS